MAAGAFAALSSLRWNEMFSEEDAEVRNAMGMTREQLAAELQRLIANGTYPPGRALPVAEICAKFMVAPGTAQRALDRLAELGLTVGGGQGRQRRVADPNQTSAHSSAIEQIRAAIADGSYPPGSPLPSEVELVKATGASRYAVRDALADLERSGEVVNRPGRRRQVAGPDPADALYEQVQAAITEDVQQGRLAAGDRLPSEAQLCKRFGMSRVTVRRALANLEVTGLLSRDPVGRRIVA